MIFFDMMDKEHTGLWRIEEIVFIIILFFHLPYMEFNEKNGLAW
jgi:hypothetical protein